MEISQTFVAFSEYMNFNRTGNQGKKTYFKTKIPEEDTLEHASSYSFSVSTLIDSSMASSRAPSIVSRFSRVVSVSVIPSPFVQSPIFYNYIQYLQYFGHAHHIGLNFFWDRILISISVHQIYKYIFKEYKNAPSEIISLSWEQFIQYWIGHM